jgi:predicted KAP-like P-loop ATPase
MSTADGERSPDDVLGYVRADVPIERREQDRLRRAPLAEAIADQVIHGPPGQGLVIGVVGKWGSGKTSVLKMVEETVREKSDVVVLGFNPWLFSDADQLVTRFLDELAAQLRLAGTREGGSAKLGRASERISSYAEALEPLSWLPLIGAWASRISSGAKVLKSIRKARTEQPSAEAQRESVREALRELEHRVLVVIDDLDRIEAAQIRDMVRLVKLVGDFPNVTYLLSYDRGPVEAALGRTPEEGSMYLEKIVQVVHDLPDPPRQAILAILLDELQVTVDSIQTGPFRDEDWQNLFPGGLRPFFRTLRDVRRYLNAVPVSLRVIGPEVAVVDVLALEAMRVFAPQAYAELPSSVSILTGESRDLHGRGRDDVEAARIQAIVAAADQFEEPVKEILRRLFPAIGNHLGGSRLVGGGQQARQQLRVAHPDVLRTYLERGLPQGVLSGALVDEVVNSLRDPDRLENLFASLDAETAEALIRRLEDYEDSFDPATAEPAIPVLLNQLPKMREGSRGMMDFGAELVIGRVILRLLRRVEGEEARLALVERALPRIHQLTGRMELIDTAGHRENVGHRLIPQDASDRLYTGLRQQIATASNDVLAKERGLVHLFVRLADGDSEDVAAIRRACEDDAVFLQMLRAGLREQRSQTVGDYAVRSWAALPWELYERWLGAEQLRQRLNEVASRVHRDSLPERARTALETAERYASGEQSNERFREGWESPPDES